MLSEFEFDASGGKWPRIAGGELCDPETPARGCFKGVEDDGLTVRGPGGESEVQESGVREDDRFPCFGGNEYEMRGAAAAKRASATCSPTPSSTSRS